MKYFITIICFLFLSFNGMSQIERSHTVHLLKKPGNKLPCNFRCLEIIDKRFIQENIGIVQKGVSNKNVVAKLKGEFEPTIKAYIGKLIRPVDPEDLSIIVHEFNIREFTKFASETGICTVEIEFARKIDGKYYSLGIFYSEIEETGVSVTNGHARRISMALDECLLKFKNSGWKNIEAELIDENSQLHNLNDNLVPKHGLYTSFNKFKKSEPLENIEYVLSEIKEGSAINRYHLDFNDATDSNLRIKYISDGEYIYLNASGYNFRKYFIQSKVIGRYIYFEDRFSGKGVTLTLGVVGALASHTKKALILDTVTGRVEVLKDYVISRITQDHPEIYREYEAITYKDLEDKERVIKKLNAKY